MSPTFSSAQPPRTASPRVTEVKEERLYESSLPVGFVVGMFVLAALVLCALAIWLLHCKTLRRGSQIHAETKGMHHPCRCYLGSYRVSYDSLTNGLVAVLPFVSLAEITDEKLSRELKTEVRNKLKSCAPLPLYCCLYIVLSSHLAQIHVLSDTVRNGTEDTNC